MYVSACLYVCYVHVVPSEYQKGASGHWELELQDVVSHMLWVLEPWSLDKYSSLPAKPSLPSLRGHLR